MPGTEAASGGWLGRLEPRGQPRPASAAHLSVQMTADLGTEQRLTQHTGRSSKHGHEDRDTVAGTLMPSGHLQLTTRQNLILDINLET